MSTASYNIDKQEKYTLVSVQEEKFTALVAPDLKSELVVLKDENVKNIIFDMSACAYCDSSGLSVILVANRICKEHNGCLVVCGLSAAVAKLIDISQLTSVLNITPTVQEAIDYIFMDELEKGLAESEGQS